MSAAAAPKKAVAPEVPPARVPIRGFLKLSHEAAAYEIPRLCGPYHGLRYALLLRILSDANRRELKGKSDGWTGIEDPQALAEGMGADVRTVNLNLEYLCRKDVGILESLDVKEARKQKLLRRVRVIEEKDAVGPVGDGAPRSGVGRIFRARLEAWAKLPSAAEIAVLDEERRQAELKQEKMALHEDPQAPVLHLSEKPVTVRRGEKASIPLSKEVRKGIARANQVDLICSEEASFDVRIVGDILQVSSVIQVDRPIEAGNFNSQPRTDSKRLTKSATDSKRVTGTDAVLAEDLGLRLGRRGVVLTADQHFEIAQALRGLSAEFLTDFVARVVERKKELKAMRFPLVKRIAQEWVGKWETQQKVIAAGGPLEEPEDPKEAFIQRLFREAREGK